MQSKLVKLGANTFLVLGTIGDIQVSIWRDEESNQPFVSVSRDEKSNQRAMYGCVRPVVRLAERRCLIAKPQIWDAEDGKKLFTVQLPQIELKDQRE